jgi:hypothetical protein
VEGQHQVLRTLREPQALARVRGLLGAGDVAHRTALADALCAQFGFIDARGRAKRSTCLKALRELERGGQLVLPAARTCPGVAKLRGLGEAVAAPVEVPHELSAVRALELVRVDSKVQRQVWNALMVREHPRGAGPLVGCQLRYLIASAHGWLGGLGFGAAALKLSAREHWVGWDDAQRRAQLHRVVGLSRLLIRPAVHCPNLASHVLGRVLRVLGADFEARFGYRPWLVETFIDTAQHDGACFRAANWQYVGDTCGRGRQDRTHAAGKTRKALYVYALEPAWRTLLGVGAAPAPTHGPLALGEGLDAAHWAQHEFGDAPLGDRRLSQRLVSSAQRQAEEPMRAFTGVAKNDWAAVKGYYRLIDQPGDSAITPANILHPHRKRTVRRMQAQPTVLCIQDGTDLNFSSHAQCTGLGVIGTNQTSSQTRGLHLHSTFAVSGEGLPLGVLRAHFEAPQPRPRGARVPREDKKTFRWIEGLRDCAALAPELPRTQLVCVMDREADIFELFDEQRTHAQVQLLVRAQHNRRLSQEHTLFDTLRHSPARGQLAIALGRQSARVKAGQQKQRPARAERTAQVTLRYEPIALSNPARGHKDQAPIHLWVVHVREEQPPHGAKALEWFLLSTLPIDSPEQAEQMLRWYALRWRIEDWHRVLKTGCRVEQLGHGSAERLERAIAMRLVIAWRIMLMTLLGRETPELPAELMFSDIELTVLGAFARTRRLPAPTTLGEAVRMVARLGGYLARTRDPPPGHQLMWYGYATLQGMCAGYALRDQAP